MTTRSQAGHRSAEAQTEPFDLHEAADELLAVARAADAGRAARTLTPGAGGALKQALLAVVAERRLADHETPGPATIQVVTGRATLTWGEDSLVLSAGEWGGVPADRHGLHAEDDTVVCSPWRGPPDFRTAREEPHDVCSCTRSRHGAPVEAGPDEVARRLAADGPAIAARATATALELVEPLAAAGRFRAPASPIVEARHTAQTSWAA